MGAVQSQTKRMLSAILIAAQLLSVSPAQAGLLNFLGLSDSTDSEPTTTSPTTEVTTAQSSSIQSKSASRPSRPRAQLPDLANGDADGVMGDNERELYVNKQIKPEDADEIGQYTVTEDQLLYSGGGANARVIGVVKKDEPFTVILPGERYSTIRLKNGNTGYVDKSKLVADGRKEAVEKELAPNFTQPKQPTRPVQKLEADCAPCTTHVDLPNAADQRQVGGLSDISRRLNRRRVQEPSESKPSSAFPANGRTSTKVARLIAASRYQAVRPRVPSKYLWKRFGNRPISGNRSKGACWGAVKDALLQAGIFKTRPGSESAKDAGPDLRRAGMKNVLSELRQTMGGDLQKLAVNAPIGSVLVYEGGLHGRKSHGHIEIKTADSLYCSDFCQVKPININQSRRLIGIYTL